MTTEPPRTGKPPPTDRLQPCARSSLSARALTRRSRVHVALPVGVFHRGEQMRLLELQALRMPLEQRHVVLEDALGRRLRAARDGVANDRVQSVAVAQRLLHEVPALELGERRPEPLRPVRAWRATPRSTWSPSTCASTPSARRAAALKRGHAQSTSSAISGKSSSCASVRTRVTPRVLQELAERFHARRARRHDASAMSSASGFQRKRRVRAATRGNALCARRDERRRRRERSTRPRAGSGAR